MNSSALLRSPSARPCARRSSGVAAVAPSAGRSAISSSPMLARPRHPRRDTLAAAAQPKQMPAWEGIFRFVTSRGLATVTPEEALELASKKGWVIVDVRPRKRHEESTVAVEGRVVSIPIYDTPDFSKPSLSRYLRAAMLASQGVAPVEQNEEFVERAVALVEGGSAEGVLMLCETGGTLVPTTAFPTGKTSRSLQAAFRMLEAGVDAGKVRHVAGGAMGWAQADLPMTADYDASGAGRTPSVVDLKKKDK